MVCSKRSGVILFLLIISLFVVSCAPGQQLTLKSVWNDILSIGQLKFLLGNAAPDNVIIGFMRLMVGILVFALLYEVSGLLGLSKNVRITVAVIISIMSLVFMPGAVLAAIGGSYATVVSLVMIGVPVVGGLYVIFRIPSTSRGLIFVKIVILLILLFVLINVRDQALTLLQNTLNAIP